MVSFSVVLYCRLISYDRNQNFANEPVQITAPTKPTDWPTIGFRQLMNNSRSECPPLTAELIQSYFATWLGYDQPDVNIPALRKGKLLLETRLEVLLTDSGPTWNYWQEMLLFCCIYRC